MRIVLENISKSLGLLNVFSDISLSVNDREIVCIVGPTGCGKTTLLSLICNLEHADSGIITVKCDRQNVIGYMMQDALMLPWRTLAENASLGAEVIKIENLTRAKLSDYYFEAFDLADYKQSYPAASSGGMKQRVALIRTLLLKPAILLLDEPFSNLDFDIKLSIQKHMIGFHRENETTIVMVTHDIEDAIALSDRVIVRDPVEARKSPRFREYFIRIWDELKYLADDNG